MSPWERGMAMSNSPGQYRALLPQHQAEFWLNNSNSMPVKLLFGIVL